LAYRKIVDPYEYDNLVSAENKRLVADFLIEKRSQNKAKGTLKQYDADHRIILTDIYRNLGNKTITTLTRKDIRNLSLLWQDRGLSSARVNRLLSSLRSCLEYLADDEDVEGYEFNVASKVKGLPKNPVREITFLSEEQIYWLRDALLERRKTLEAVYLMLSYISAARRNEVHQTLKEGLTERYFTNIVIGKRAKKFRLYYDQATQDLIRQYLSERGTDDLPQLFVKCYVNGRKEPVHNSTFNEWCAQMGRMLSAHEGREININPHCYRHSRLENLSRSGIPLEKLKSLAHHESVATTETYLAKREDEDIADILGIDAELLKEG
jgi:site-specific recombinase XerD